MYFKLYIVWAEGVFYRIELLFPCWRLNWLGPSVPCTLYIALWWIQSKLFYLQHHYSLSYCDKLSCAILVCFVVFVLLINRGMNLFIVLADFNQDSWRYMYTKNIMAHIYMYLLFWRNSFKKSCFSFQSCYYHLSELKFPSWYHPLYQCYYLIKPLKF